MSLPFITLCHQFHITAIIFLFDDLSTNAHYQQKRRKTDKLIYHQIAVCAEYCSPWLWSGSWTARCSLEAPGRFMVYLGAPCHFQFWKENDLQPIRCFWAISLLNTGMKYPTHPKIETNCDVVTYQWWLKHPKPSALSKATSRSQCTEHYIAGRLYTTTVHCPNHCLCLSRYWQKVSEM